METLMQMRNDLLQKLEKKRKGVLTPNRLISTENGHKDQRREFLKNVIDRSKQNEISDSVKKHNSRSDSSENDNQTSLFKQHQKINGLSKKLKTNSHFSKKRNTKGECLKKQSKDFQGNKSLSSQSRETRSGNLQTENLKRKPKTKRKNDKVVRDEASRLQRRARYLLIKLKLEQNLIDAYTGEGWKGHSREKIKPVKELQRAKRQVLNCKLGIRDTVRQLDSLGSVGKIDDSYVSSDGSVHHEHIFCKECKTQEVSEDNDIILCDGTCNCAFHQKCIDPPLATKDIPPEDEGWLCKFCDCKMDLVDAMNAHLGTQFSDDCTWQDIFKEEANLSDARMMVFNHEEEWPDDESDDNDYDPERDGIHSTSRCDSRDDSGPHEETSTSSSSCSLESEVYWENGLSTESNEIFSTIPHLRQNCATDFNDSEIISGPRERSAVNYIKLYDEMFSKDVSNTDVCSEDEDWDPRKRRRRKKECDAASTLMTLGVTEMKFSDSPTREVGKDHPPDSRARKRPSRIPADVLQKLRQAFAENELPSRDVKKDISDVVGLEYRKVHKWFKNARYTALKNRKKEGSLKSTASDKSDNKVDQNIEVIVSKGSSSISVCKKLLKEVSCDDNVTTLISSAKKKQLEIVSLGENKENVELSDDMSLKKHLSYLKAKKRREKRGIRDTEHPQVESAEMQIEQLWQIESKLWKLKEIVSTFQNDTTNDFNDQRVKENPVVYVPFAEVKEKL